MADSAAYEAITGLYELDDGRLLEIFDLIDQTRFHQLVAVEPGSGRVRTLYPVSAEAEDADETTTTAAPGRPDSAGALRFRAGSAWFVQDPPGYSVRFTGTNGDIRGVVMDEDGRATAGRRVRFDEREVTFSNGDIALSGTLILPEGPGPHPGVAIVHGSGPLTRRAPRYMGDLLAYHGIAALVYDKRGTGESTGRWQTASYTDLAGDAEAALDRLLASPQVDDARVGLFGSSEAGYIVPAVAARRPEVSLLVCRVCPALPQRQVAPVQQRSALARQGFSPDEVDEALAFHIALMDYAVDRTGYGELQQSFDRLRGRRWMRRYGFQRVPPPEAPYWDRFRAGLTVDPGAFYDQMDIPVLVVLGERDERIAVDQHRAAFEEYARRSGNDALVVEVMPRASHGLMEVRLDSAGDPLPPVRFSPAFHGLVVGWIAERFGVQAPPSSAVASGRLAAARRFRRLVREGSYDAARAMMAPDARRWFAPREGPGSPWTVGASSPGPWAAWDEHFRTEQEVVDWRVDARSVTVVVSETNDYFRLLERGRVTNEITYFFDDADRIEGLLIAGVGERPPGRTEEFLAWARANEPEELAALMPGGEIDPSGDHPQRFRRLLERWRAASPE